LSESLPLINVSWRNIAITLKTASELFLLCTGSVHGRSQAINGLTRKTLSRYLRSDTQNYGLERRWTMRGDLGQSEEPPRDSPRQKAYKSIFRRTCTVRCPFKQCDSFALRQTDHQLPQVCHLAQIGECRGFKVSSEWDAKLDNEFLSSNLGILKSLKICCKPSISHSFLRFKKPVS
jgi:hypothetical protein